MLMLALDWYNSTIPLKLGCEYCTKPSDIKWLVLWPPIVLVHRVSEHRPKSSASPSSSAYMDGIRVGLISLIKIDRNRTKNTQNKRIHYKNYRKQRSEKAWNLNVIATKCRSINHYKNEMFNWKLQFDSVCGVRPQNTTEIFIWLLSNYVNVHLMCVYLLQSFHLVFGGCRFRFGHLWWFRSSAYHCKQSYYNRSGCYSSGSNYNHCWLSLFFLLRDFSRWIFRQNRFICT